MVKKGAKILLVVILHLLASAIIIYSFLPIANWYLNYRPVWGVDFYLTVNLVSLLKQNIVFPFAFWNYAWFGGFPVFLYPFLHIYLAGLLSQFFDLIFSLQLWMMVSTALFILGGYFLFYVISRNFILSTILAVATAYSSGLYQTLTWAGSLPSYATQAFFPWALGFLYLFIKTEKFKFLLSSALLSGISILGHPLTFIVYILPAVTILIFTNLEHGLKLFWKLKVWFVFILITFIVGMPQLYPTISSVAKSAFQSNYSGSLSTTTLTQADLDIGKEIFSRAQPIRAITDNHLAPFVLAAIIFVFFLGGLLVGKKINPVGLSLPFIVIAGYFTFYIWLFGQGISIYHGGWYRLFWSVPIWVGSLACIFWYLLFDNINSVLKNKVVKISTAGFLNALIAVIGIALILKYPADKAIDRIIYRSQVSSAHPDILNLQVASGELEVLKKRLLPEWMNGQETQYRLYSADQTVNIWWNSSFKLPLARGYLDPPSERGYIFWLDAALSETEGQPQLVKSFNYPFETALSNALFLIDWNSIRYFEGGHTGWAYTSLPTYLKEPLLSKEEVLDFNDAKYTKRSVTLNYSEFKDEVTSPILASTNASTIAIFGSDAGYEAVVRAIAEKNNLNSQVLIPVKMGKFIDSYNLSTLKQFDSFYLYDYDYKNRGNMVKLVQKLAQSGKKIFIETGVEVKDSQGDLPEIFPLERVERKGLGREWDFEASDQIFTKDVDLSKFSPPLFDDSEWKLSFGKDSDLRGDSKIILKNQGKVVLATRKIGEGEVIWSGLNFAYHLGRNHNKDEAQLFINILSQMVDLNKKPVPWYEAQFLNPNTRVIRTEGAKGILFKEQAYNGWQAANPKIFKVGPANPGFIYIPLNNQSRQEIKLSYVGSFENKVTVTTSIVLAILLLDEVLFAGILFGRLRRLVFRKSKKLIGRWWDKEDEEV